MTNPLLEPWTAPFGLPPFDRIADDDFAPAFEAALTEARDNIAAIAADPAAPDFANTIEALELADRVVVMNHGRIEQIGSPAQVYDEPASAFVCDFLGQVNRFDCDIENGLARTTQGAELRVPGLNGTHGAATCFVRPHEIDLVPIDREGPEAAQVRLIHQVGPNARVELDYAGHVLEVEVGRERLPALSLSVGAWCALRINNARVFPR